MNNITMRDWETIKLQNAAKEESKRMMWAGILMAVAFIISFIWG